MLMNIVEGEECRIAVVEDGRLEELYMERTSDESHVGNIYKARVNNVEPSIQAAFVDFGLPQHGFLHISDLHPQYFGRGRQSPSVEESEAVGRKKGHYDRPPIQKCLRRGDEVIVQVIKEGIGTKGATLTTYMSLPGRFLVLMPGMSRTGVSRRIEDEDDRKKLRKILDELQPPKNLGFIIRTAGIGRTKRELQRDLVYLTRLWKQIARRIRSENSPAEIYRESDLVIRTIRDVFNTDISRIVVDSESVAEKVRDFLRIAMPRTVNRVHWHEDSTPLFHAFKIEKDIESIHSRHVKMPSGGSLVIDPTEALVAIDVNSGKYRGKDNVEQMALKINVEAAGHIARQLRLRDLGGMVVCDFIDLREDKNRREVERTLRDALKRDRAKTKVLKMSQFGLIEMTRQRMRPSLEHSRYSDCPHCLGTGRLKTPESMTLECLRQLQVFLKKPNLARVELTVTAEVVSHLQNRKRKVLVEMEVASGKEIIIHVSDDLGPDEIRFEGFDARKHAVKL